MAGRSDRHAGARTPGAAMRNVTNLNTPAAKRSKELSNRTAELTAELARFTIPKLKPSVPATTHKAAALPHHQQQVSGALPAPQRRVESFPPITESAERSAATKIPPSAAAAAGSAQGIRGVISEEQMPQSLPQAVVPALFPTALGAPCEGATSPSAHTALVGAVVEGMQVAREAAAEVEAGWALSRRVDPVLHESEALGGGAASSAPDVVEEPCKPASAGSVGRSSRQRQKVRSSDGWASPGYEPEKEQLRGKDHDTQQATTEEEEEEGVPLACQTAIVKRRHRRTSAMPVSRYGSWAQQADLEAALLGDLQDGPDSEDDSEGASAHKMADMGARRQSALPVMSGGCLGALAGGAALGATLEEAAKARSRQRRKTLAPSQTGAAAHVATLSKELSELASELLPAEAVAGRRAAVAVEVAPLRQRLADSWQGKSYYDRLKEIAEEESETEAVEPKVIALIAAAATPQPEGKAPALSGGLAQLAAGTAAGQVLNPAPKPPVAGRAAAVLVRKVAGGPTAAAHLASSNPRKAPQAEAAALKPRARKAIAAPKQLTALPTLAPLPLPSEASASGAGHLLSWAGGALSEGPGDSSSALQTEFAAARALAAATAEKRGGAEKLVELECRLAAPQVVEETAEPAASAKAAKLDGGEKLVPAAAAKQQSKAEARLRARIEELQVAYDKKDTALEAERSMRSTAEKQALEAHACRAADARTRMAAERKVAAMEKKLESQSRKLGELQSEAEAAAERQSASGAAVAALEAQLLAVQSATAAQAAAGQALAEQTVAAAAAATALRQSLGAKALAHKPMPRRGV